MPELVYCCAQQLEGALAQCQGAQISIASCAARWCANSECRAGMLKGQRMAVAHLQLVNWHLLKAAHAYAMMQIQSGCERSLVQEALSPCATRLTHYEAHTAYACHISRRLSAHACQLNLRMRAAQCTAAFGAAAYTSVAQMTCTPLARHCCSRHATSPSATQASVTVS